MAKSKYSLSEAQIAKRIKEGRGAGSGTDYSPWVRVDEVPSLGRSRQVYSHLTKRIHHLLSDLEFAVFLLLDNNPFVTDIREQFPLIRDDTRDIARGNNLPHPANNGVDTVILSDFLVDSRDKSEPKFVLQAKYTDSLSDARTVEKLEIERRYWKQKELPWYLVTEREIDPVAKANIDWLYVTSPPKRQPAHSVLELICSNFLAAIAKQSRAREKF
ncbi:Tn7 transposase TnsA N-terminal domain-containing protein [Idiomarina loihiensis]|uniref:TnsA endonuclease N-terminal domain-containing protein n=1 Tax=Idiomarina loihiensis TaxID=135577 RepID=UPI00129CBE21|nr:TnsA endonuclease N-terminal domain-containing protein [Idiomarina loihiensis]MRJ44276.1 heteromeric transposase endonuclease subunit TnsA [Idiomarina loihiensis]UTW32682.1 Tn7 transposase TnsA N-terminal domain-containing protein [Idiomarina loihiensis]